MAEKPKKKWIQKAHLKKGAFTAQAEAAGKSVHQMAEEHKNDSGKTGKRARLALTFEKMAHHAEGTAKVRLDNSGTSQQSPPGPGQTPYNGSWGAPTPNQDLRNKMKGKYVTAAEGTANVTSNRGANLGRFLYAKKGETRVPGKDKGKDTVPAMLRPGEAVLVPGAAEEVGRKEIAALNAKHNKRSPLHSHPRSP